MSLSAISKSLRIEIGRRDAGQRRYCHLKQYGQGAVFHINHVVPRSRGGRTDESNLVLQCPYCSLHKSNKVNGPDPQTGETVPLLHPLQQRWADHLSVRADGQCIGLSETGRATVAALRMNDSLPLMARVIQIRIGLLKASD